MKGACALDIDRPRSNSVIEHAVAKKTVPAYMNVDVSSLPVPIRLVALF